MNLDVGEKKITKGFKGVRLNFLTGKFYCSPRSKPFHFEIGKVYSKKMPPKLCKNGFHFCKTLNQVLSHYNTYPGTYYAEIDTCNSQLDISYSKIAAQKIKIVKVLPFLEIAKKLGMIILESGFKTRLYTHKKDCKGIKLLFNTPELEILFKRGTIERKTVTLTKIRTNKKFEARHYYIVS